MLNNRALKTNGVNFYEGNAGKLLIFFLFFYFIMVILIILTLFVLSIIIISSNYEWTKDNDVKIFVIFCIIYYSIIVLGFFFNGSNDENELKIFRCILSIIIYITNVIVSFVLIVSKKPDETICLVFFILHFINLCIIFLTIIVSIFVLIKKHSKENIGVNSIMV